MDEEKKNKDTETKPDENTDEGIQSKTTSELDRADQIAERLKRENDRREELLTREENLQARRAVGGESEAGQETSKPKEVTPKEYAAQVMAGDI